jgi:ankyrin repeat protein
MSNKQQKQLYSAVKTGNLEKVREIIENNRLLIKEASGMLLLCEAIKTENVEIIRLLLAFGVEVNDEDKILYDNEIPLSIACYSGNLEIVQLVLDYGAIINTCREDPEYLNPLMCAVINSDLNLVKLLVERGADVNVLRAGGSSALSIAIQGKCQDIVEYLTPLIN